MSQTRRCLAVTINVDGTAHMFVVMNKAQMQALLFGFAVRHWQTSSTTSNKPIPIGSRRAVIEGFFLNSITAKNTYSVADCLLPPEEAIGKMVIEAERKIDRQNKARKAASAEAATA